MRLGRPTFGRFLGLKTLPNRLEKSRYCFVISTKISKKATKRNLLKRRLREITRLSLLRLVGGYDVVVLTKPNSGILEKTYSELETELSGLLKKGRLFTTK